MIKPTISITTSSTTTDDTAEGRRVHSFSPFIIIIVSLDSNYLFAQQDRTLPTTFSKLIE